MRRQMFVDGAPQCVIVDVEQLVGRLAFQFTDVIAHHRRAQRRDECGSDEFLPRTKSRLSLNGERRRREATDDKSVVGDDVRRVDEAVGRLRVAASDDDVKRVARTMRRSAHGLNEVKRRQYVQKRAAYRSVGSLT